MQKSHPSQLIPFKPFFDAGNILVHISAACALGVFFMIFLEFFTGSDYQDNLIWLISPLIAVLSLSNNIGARYIRNMLYEMEIRAPLKKNRELSTLIRSSGSHAAYLKIAVLFSLLYGTLSMFIPGVREGEPEKMISLTFSFMTIGFCAGIAVRSIFIVHRVILVFLKNNEKAFDYNAPDRCGGSLFLGNSLIVFSALALFNGALFSVFFIHFDFGNHPGELLLYIKYFWFFLPYALGILVLMGPAVAIHNALKAYQLQEEEYLIRKIAEIKKALERKGLSREKMETLQKDHVFQHQVWEETARMKTWPFNVHTNIKYLTFFTSNTVASYLAFGKKVLYKFLLELFP